MNWTENKPATEGVSHYDHTILESPIGKFIIEWKSWKEVPSYDVMLNDDWVGSEYDLEDAKNLAEKHLVDISDKLTNFIDNLYSQKS